MFSDIQFTQHGKRHSLLHRNHCAASGLNETEAKWISLRLNKVFSRLPGEGLRKTKHPRKRGAFGDVGNSRQKLLQSGLESAHAL
jgi:hypothetical protein